MKKKLLSALLALVIVLTMLPLAALAVDGAGSDNKVTVTVDFNYPQGYEGEQSTEPESVEGTLSTSKNDSVPFLPSDLFNPKADDTIKFLGWEILAFELDEEEDVAVILKTITDKDNVLLANDVDDKVFLIASGQWETVSPDPTPTKYTVTIPRPDNGIVVSTGGTSFESGATVSLLVKPSSGYKLGEITVTQKGSDTKVNVAEDYSFTMPACDVVVNATFVEDNVPAPADEYNVTIGTTANGTVTADKTKAKENETVTITATPNEGYVVDSVSVTKGGEEVSVTAGEDGAYTFTMPAADVSVAVQFKSVSNKNLKIGMGSNAVAKFKMVEITGMKTDCLYVIRISSKQNNEKDETSILIPVMGNSSAVSNGAYSFNAKNGLYITVREYSSDAAANGVADSPILTQITDYQVGSTSQNG